MGPEWCYQWDDPEFVEKYYKSLKRQDKEATSKQLVGVLNKPPKKESDRPHHKKSDPKDALYYSDF